MRLVALLLSLCLLALPARAQDPAPVPALSVAVGETVTARVTPDGRFIELSRVRRPISAPQTVRDTVSFSFFDLEGRRALLNTNGTRDILTYRSRAYVGDRAVATDVCPTVPGFASVQTWREPVDRVELSDPRVVAEGESPVPMCG